MRIKIIAALVLLVPATAATAAAQRTGDKWFGMTWSMSSPTANSKQFANDYSFRGLGMEWRQFKGSSTSVGLSLGWNLMNEETFETSSIHQVDVTGLQFRYINAYSILLAAHKYLGTNHFGLAPEFGIAVPLRHTVDGEAFYTAVRYNYAFAAGGSPYQSWIGIDIGIATRRF